MKGLLHSKIFKKNLAKWFVMYLGVISLLTTIITYSKYMSEMQFSDNARVAKFNVKILPNDCTNINNENVCNSGIVRPTSNLTYSFNVDTSELEVKTEFALTIYIDSNFTGTISSLKHPDVNYNSKGLVQLGINEYNMYVISETIEAGEGYLDTYNIDIKYNTQNGINIEKDYNVVRVDYSAKQIK